MHGNVYQKQTVKPPAVNAFWRGLGCIIMFLLPVVTYGLTYIFTPIIIATRLVPGELMNRIIAPDWALRSRILGGVTTAILNIDHPWLNVCIFLIILLLLTGVFSLFYVGVMQMIGPPRYGEKDAPPSKYKGKTYTR